MAVGDDNKQAIDIKDTFRWWWIVGGSVITGASIFSLAVTYGDVGLKGLVALAYEQYKHLRDLAFTPLDWLFRLFFPTWEIPAAIRDILLGLSALCTVVVRTLDQSRRAGIGTGFAVITIGAMFAFFINPPLVDLGEAYKWSTGIVALDWLMTILGWLGASGAVLWFSGVLSDDPDRRFDRSTQDLLLQCARKRRSCVCAVAPECSTLVAAMSCRWPNVLPASVPAPALPPYRCAA